LSVIGNTAVDYMAAHHNSPRWASSTGKQSTSYPAAPVISSPAPVSSYGGGLLTPAGRPNQHAVIDSGKYQSMLTVWAWERCRISSPHFLAESRKIRLSRGSFVLLCFCIDGFFWVVFSSCIVYIFNLSSVLYIPA